MGWDLGWDQAYRRFRRRVTLATGGLFVLGVGAAVAQRAGDSLWIVVKWAAISAPTVVAIAVFLLLPLGRMAEGLGLNDAGTAVRLRPTVVFWMLSAIAVPWIAAWVVADLAGAWFGAWWQAGQHDSGPGFYLWTIRLLAGVATYSLASAVGLLLAVLLDRTTEEDGTPP